jgi:hypothetical protein
MNPKQRWLSPKIIVAGITLSLLAQISAQTQQLMSLPADDPEGPLPMQVPTTAPGASGAWQVVVANTSAGADFVGDFPVQFRIVATGSVV